MVSSRAGGYPAPRRGTDLVPEGTVARTSPTSSASGRSPTLGVGVPSEREARTVVRAAGLVWPGVLER